MIWIKAKTGDTELKTHALIQNASTRNLLMVIVGAESEEMLLKYSIGVTSEEFRLLNRLAAIEPAGHPTGTSAAGQILSKKARAETPLPAHSVLGSGDASRFALRLSRLVSKHLGLAGMGFTSTIENARTIEELRAIANQVRHEVTADMANSLREMHRRR